MQKHLLALAGAIAIALAPALASAEIMQRPKRPEVPRETVVNLQGFRLAPDLPAVAGARKATKLVYVMGAHDIWAGSAELTIRGLSGLPQLEPTAHSLAFVGGIEGDAAVYSFGDDPARTTRKSPLAPGTKRVPSNSLQLMTQVLAWAWGSYPGEARYLEIDSHGGGVFGIGSDDQSPYRGSGGRLMPIQGLARALRDGSGGKPIDVVFFNACDMASVEALYEIAPSVRFAVASENPINGRAATVIEEQPQLFERLVRMGTPPAQLARELARQATLKNSRGVTSEVAIDTAQLAPLVDQIGKLSSALLQAPRSERAVLARAIEETPGGRTRDLWQLVRTLQRTAQTAPVKEAARTLFRLQARATLYERTPGDAAFVDERPTRSREVMAPDREAPGMPEAPNPGGLSIYAGGSGLSFLDHGYVQTRFARATGWDKVLRALGRP
jgi:hypothetical protein